MKKLISLIAVIFLGTVLNNTQACSSIIVSGKVTADGRPLMWKHRDTSSEHNKLLYFDGKKYNYMGIVSLGKSEFTNIWMGMNAAGFCIMNTASYNINDGLESQGNASEGKFMALALSTCSTLEDFEKLLKNTSQPTGLAANFGVLDANGGAAYYEVGDYKVVKIDVNDQATAPLGYLVKTNFSDNGDIEKGQGFARYVRSSNIFLKDAMSGGITVESILGHAERSLVNGYTNEDLRDKATSSDKVKLVHFKDNIARKSSTSSTIFKGVMPGEDPMSTVMWTVCGWPLATVAYPVWMNKDQLLPELLTAEKGKTSALCDAGLKVKALAMSITRGHGQDYININILHNTDNTGTLQWILPLEDKVIKHTHTSMDLWHNRTPTALELKKLYGELDKLIIEAYKKNGLELE